MLSRTHLQETLRTSRPSSDLVVASYVTAGQGTDNCLPMGTFFGPIQAEKLQFRW